jgi:serine protease AprX
LKGWQTEFKGGLPVPANEELAYSINRNRTATLALKYSTKTVKADAATRLFSIRCKDIRWAVIDCGIDATHPAFLDHERIGDSEEPSKADRPMLSRVVETYDFTHLADLLLGRTDKIPSHYLVGEGATSENFEEVVRRIQLSKNIDWELLRPFLRISHDPKNYVPPEDSHGTHVAGILGADWRLNREPMVGLCPDIKLIDIRVCYDDGSSDEFIILSALQFLRYLNSIAEKTAVHGVNMSLSIPYDWTAFACGETPVCAEANRTSSSGIVVVAAAGNCGYRKILTDGDQSIDQFCSVSITDPGNAEHVITVGSTHRISPHTYGVSYFSSRGPTGDGRNKPDLLAPGEKIVGPALDEKTLPLDGTSMAAPHVSGAAAMLMARHTELQGKPDRIKKILCKSATDLGRERHFQGAGLLDILRAIQSV